jgi:predicted GH43/DUF377 family glycosyl hydrolase
MNMRSATSEVVVHPIETKAGWLLIYHGVHDTTEGYVYSACAALLDLEEPEKELARLPYPAV